MARKINNSFNECVWVDFLAHQEAHIPPLPDIKQISKVVLRILGGNPGQYQLQGTNTFLVGSGRDKILVDTGEGMPIWAKTIANVVEREGLTIKFVLLTHWHGDHTGGVPDLLALYPHLSSAIHKNSPDTGQLPIEDGQIFQVEGATIKAVFTPGHAFDHMSFVLEEESALFTGDNVLGHGFTVIEDLGLYMSTLDIMEDLNCSKGYPAHGIVIEDLPSKLREYKAQQLGREKKVLQALNQSRAQQVGKVPRGKGSVTVSELVKAIGGAKRWFACVYV